MRTFDTVGIVLVAGWVAFTGMYVWRHEAEPTMTTVEASSRSLGLEEGDRWMLLRRHNQDIGYIRRVTTRLTDGWLMEYEVLVVVEVTGRKYGVDAAFDARIDENGVMTGFSAKGEIAGRSISATGNIEDRTLRMTLKLGDESRSRSVTFDEPPKLTGTRLAAIADDTSLEPGDHIEQSVFAPTRFGMQSITFEFVGRRTIDLLTRKAEALYLRQHLAGEEYDIYIDDDGSILLREFPFRIYGVYTDAKFASSRAATLKKRLESAETLPAGTLERAGDMLDMMGGDSPLSPGGGLLSSDPMEMLDEIRGNSPGTATGDTGTENTSTSTRGDVGP